MKLEKLRLDLIRHLCLLPYKLVGLDTLTNLPQVSNLEDESLDENQNFADQSSTEHNLEDNLLDENIEGVEQEVEKSVPKTK